MSLDLAALARAAMVERGLLPDFDAAARNEVEQLAHASLEHSGKDLRAQLWSSIDNRESRDLDQIEVVEDLGDDRVRVLIGIADVDALVHKSSAIDRHAYANTCTVYAGVTIFPMLPEALSTGLTSLNEDQDRAAIVISYVVDAQGDISEPEVYRALVRNQARLSYADVAAWLDGQHPAPPRVAANPELQKQLRLQDAVAQRLRRRRHERGALELETIEARPVTRDGDVVDLELTRKNRARELIEDFMIAANATMARFLESRRVPALRRVVKEPKRWERIVQLAKGVGTQLPEKPSARALGDFLTAQRERDPLHFPDLSLSVVKLMGPGEYAVELPGGDHDGHFGLAVQDYTHSTAPNRRFADLVTQRLVKSCALDSAPTYDVPALHDIAQRRTQKAGDATKVERQMRKSAAALLLQSQIGHVFDAIVTGVTDYGTFVRLLAPPAEGRVIQGERGMDVGDRVHVRLTATDPRRGFIDFARA